MRGQFYSLDVFIAAVILVSGSVVLLYSIVGSMNLQQAQLFSSDIMRESLSSTVRELNYPIISSASRGYANQSNPYDIRNFEMTLGELIGEYHHLMNKSDAAGDAPALANYTERRNRITTETIGLLISNQYSYTISIGDDVTSMDLITERVRIPPSDAEFIVAARAIVAGIDRDREFYGPYTLEVMVWN